VRKDIINEDFSLMDAINSKINPDYPPMTLENYKEMIPRAIEDIHRYK
jgi:hypothetical protein